MKNILGTAVIVAALAAPAFAGQPENIVVDEAIMAPVEEVAGSSAGSVGSSGGGVLPALLLLGLLAAASSGS